jgi:hypothetical protein
MNMASLRSIHRLRLSIRYLIGKETRQGAHNMLYRPEERPNSLSNLTRNSAMALHLQFTLVMLRMIATELNETMSLSRSIHHKHRHPLIRI